MVRALLVRGLLAGVLAGLLAFGFARVFGEPQVAGAIQFEAQHAADAAAHPADSIAAHQAHAADHAAEPELVSRGVQANLGLLTGVLLYSAAFGGLFALVFAFAYGRLAPGDPRSLAALLAVAGFITVVIVPALKYPANPPSVGDHETIGVRSALFLVMLVVSLGAGVVGLALRNALQARHGAWTAALAGAAAFVVVVGTAMALLPSVDEVPAGFPAVLLWRFRVASLGTQLVMWTTLGLIFGALTRRSRLPHPA